ncbi:MAG: glycosyl hydrolase family 28-related protein [Pirellulaceae bacterium]
MHCDAAGRRTFKLGCACHLIGLGMVCLWAGEVCAVAGPVLGAAFDPTVNHAFPVSPAIVNVTQPPYNAKGDGQADDTDAIQRALHDAMGLHKVIYLPAGTYNISKTINWSKRNSAGKEAWGKNFVQGQNVAKTILRLKDATFTDAQQPQSIMWCGGFGSADWFHNYVQDITFDVGEMNPGAIGLQFYSNNSGAIRNCRFLAGEGSGLIGLDLGHRDMNGPLLVRNCEVVGFRRGIQTARAVNGQTFEQITLRGQAEFGFSNEGQAISIRGLVSHSAVPAVQSYGTLCLIDAFLQGQAPAERVPAIVNYNGGRVYLRDIATTGYGRALGDISSPDSAAAFRRTGPDKPGSEGPNIAEYWSHPPTTLFPSTAASLRLTVKEPPALPWDDPNNWANVDDFGADPTGQQDSSAAIQQAMDSGATTLFLAGNYALTKTVVIRGNVRCVRGVGGMIDYTSQVQPDFRIVDGQSPVVSLEHFSHVHGGLEIDTNRTVLFRSVSDCDLTMTPRAEGGEIFLEDFVTHNLKLRKQRVWARQLNIENEGTHLVNDASDLWVLGYKTERGGTLLETRRGGRSEILGGFSYTTTAGKLAPMFVNDNASVFAFFSEVCYNDDPFATLIRESRHGKTKTLKRGEGGISPYIAIPPGR